SEGIKFPLVHATAHRVGVVHGLAEGEPAIGPAAGGAPAVLDEPDVAGVVVAHHANQVSAILALAGILVHARPGGGFGIAVPGIVEIRPACVREEERQDHGLVFVQYGLDVGDGLGLADRRGGDLGDFDRGDAHEGVLGDRGCGGGGGAGTTAVRIARPGVGPGDEFLVVVVPIRKRGVVSAIAGGSPARGVVVGI